MINRLEACISILQVLLDRESIALFATNNEQETPFDVVIRAYCANYHDFADDEENSYYPLMQCGMNAAIKLLYQAMKKQSPADEVDFSSQYYAETKNGQLHTIENVYWVMRHNIDSIVTDDFFRLIQKQAYPNITSIIENTRAEIQGTFEREQASAVRLR